MTSSDVIYCFVTWDADAYNTKGIGVPDNLYILIIYYLFLLISYPKIFNYLFSLNPNNPIPNTVMTSSLKRFL